MNKKLKIKLNGKWGNVKSKKIFSSLIIKKTNLNIDKIEEWIEKEINKDRTVIGYISYEIAYELFNIKPVKQKKSETPIIELFSVKLEKDKKTKNEENLKFKFKSNLSKKTYSKGFKKIKNHIKEGDIYQLNYTQKFTAKTNLNGEEIFNKLKQNIAVNYRAYIRTKNIEIISFSPEKFIEIKGGRITTEPIKGTAPRGKTKKEDKNNKNELLKSQKEKAELNMITDLLRNDLGKICTAGSVKIKKHRKLQKIKTVWHTYSKIEGKLKPKISKIRALISMMPGGSISGCPKKRAIEIISQIETEPRGIYTGCIVKITKKKLISSIVIRTIIKKKTIINLQVGGGIVQDSKEELEYQELFHKIAPFNKK